MKSSRFVAVSVLVSALCGAPLAAPIHISVDTLTGSQEHGAGISVGKGLECYVVAPRHVVEMAEKITVKDLRGNTSTAEPFQDAPAEIDAILLKVEQDHRLDCPEDWDDGSDAESILYDVEFVISRKVKGGGVDSRRFFPGSVTSTTIELQPFSNDKANRLVEGDSGSALYAKNLPLGMIVTVHTETGEAEAVKQSQLHALFGREQRMLVVMGTHGNDQPVDEMGRPAHDVDVTVGYGIKAARIEANAHVTRLQARPAGHPRRMSAR